MARFSSIVKGATKLFVDNSPTILTAVSVAGVATTAILSAKAAPHAVDDIREAEAEKGEVLTPTEKFKVAWVHYIPAAGVGAMTITCIIFANTTSSKRSAILASAYSLSEARFKDYRDKVAEHIGAKKEREVRDEVAQDRVIRNPAVDKEIIITGNGEVMCLDESSGRYFKSDMQTIRAAINDVNEQILTNSYASLNDFYAYLGLKPTGTGEELGWQVGRDKLDANFSTTLTADGQPCIVVAYSASPIRDYWKFGN